MSFVRSLVAVLLGVAVTAAAGVTWLRAGDGCLGRCGEGTQCTEHRCVVAAAPAPSPAPTPSKEPRSRRRRSSTPDPLAAAAPEVQLKPGDEKPLAQGDALGRPEHIDLTATGDDGKELTQEDLDRVFHPAEPAITRCIATALGDAPLDAGKVEVGFRVEKGGEVSRVRVEGPTLLQRNNLYRCVRAVVTALRFPRSGGASVVTYPFEIK